MLVFDGVSVSIGGVDLSYPNVQVPQGDVLLLRGASGRGKSTALSVLAGLRQPSTGRVVVAETVLFDDQCRPASALQGAALDRWRARHIGVLPQLLHLSAALSVADNLGLVYWASGVRVDPAHIHTVLTRLGVADVAQSRPHQLSVVDILPALKDGDSYRALTSIAADQSRLGGFLLLRGSTFRFCNFDATDGLSTG